MSSCASIMNNKKIPFHSQIWELEKWKELGFKSKEDATYWQDSSCGVICLKMAAEDLGAYSHSSGWSHQGLVNLAQQYGLKAYSSSTLSEEKLRQLLDQESLIIVSIKWAFEANRSLKERILFWRKRGGHLALVIGYKEGEGFVVHHTSTWPDYNWEGELIPFKKFNDGFTERGIILST
jgi:Peptidase_C39 like family